MLADPQETLITAKLSLILIEGGTKYGQWAALTDEEIATKAGLDTPRYRALVGVCRDAISEMRGAHAYHIEGPEEVRAEWFDGIKVAGLMSGASTPGWLVDQVEARMEELSRLPV